ncbi:malonate decarboxylase holo-[acyl-carrier-protein] synthase [Derxia lacustris]|uniref:malonate decarboxylase holo-[acyl-carrier-protein] synthase n=1 Tax=Derxia lacustris TaxID=764842 RepID=UPI000A1782ED|nr:malonate decarboxylase holo-[acyl-carrier-protein] synthase [Derxia lacustris]
MKRWRRHDLVWLRTDGPAAAVAAPADRDALQAWIAEGRPVVVSRQMPGAHPAAGVAAGFTLPGTGARRRVALAFPPESVQWHAEPPRPRELVDAAPAGWRAALKRLDAEAEALGLRVGVCGSLVNQHFTGEPCLRPDSDIDLVVDCADAAALRRALDWLPVAARMLPLDGELRLGDWAVAWREAAAALARGGAASCLAKSDTAVALIAFDDWLAGAVDGARHAA